MKKTALSLALAMAVLPGFAQDNDSPEKKKGEYEFTVIKENPITSIKDQYRSGTCWCFSALSFLESEIIPEKGDTVDLSEMFVVSKSYHDRGIKYVRLDDHLNFAAGSSFGDVLHVIKDYGIVPQEAMPGLNYGTEKPEHFEMDEGLKGYVDAIVKAVNNASDLGAQSGDKLVLTTMNGLGSSTNAQADADGLAQLDVNVVALTLNGETITSCILDGLQAKVNFDATGTITTDLTAAPQTKNELGEAYGMKAYAGSTYEWNEQAASFAAYVTGKTAEEVAGIAVDESSKVTEADLATSVTISVGGFLGLIAKAAA